MSRAGQRPELGKKATMTVKFGWKAGSEQYPPQHNYLNMRWQRNKRASIPST